MLLYHNVLLLAVWTLADLHLHLGAQALQFSPTAFRGTLIVLKVVWFNLVSC